jgi:hypothetical protein
MIERKIKELSIALEALSRISGWTATGHFDEVSNLLGKTLKEAKEPPTPTEPPPTQTKTDDDDIPF